MAAMVVEDATGNRSAFLVEERVASGLAASYGVPGAEVVRMTALIGKHIEFVESNVGVIVQVTVLEESATTEDWDA